jgi:hypothetical protein
MPHPIFVCIPCKLIMHTCRNAGIHALQHHSERYYILCEKYIMVYFGECINSHWLPCKDPHNRTATEKELKIVRSLIRKRVNVNV